MLREVKGLVTNKRKAAAVGGVLVVLLLFVERDVSAGCIVASLVPASTCKTATLISARQIVCARACVCVRVYVCVCVCIR